jgi:hypothetical protein
MNNHPFYNPANVCCNPINPHTSIIDYDCMVFLQTTPDPNIISKSLVNNIKKFYFISPIKDFEYRSALYYIPQRDNFPEFYLYECNNIIINKIVNQECDSGINSPDNTSDSSSDDSDFSEGNEIKTQREDLDIIQCKKTQTSISTKTIGTQYDFINDVCQTISNKYLEHKYYNIWKSNIISIKNKSKYLEHKYYNLWKSNVITIKINRKLDRKNKKKLKRKKQLEIKKQQTEIKNDIISFWKEYTRKSKFLGSKYIKIWKTNLKNNIKKRKLENLKLLKKYFKLWKLETVNSKLKLELENLKIKTIKSNEMYKSKLKRKYFKIWKNNILNCSKKSKNKSLVLDPAITTILKFMTFDNFKNLVAIFPKINMYLSCPKIEDSQAYHCNYVEMYSRKIIKISLLQILKQITSVKHLSVLNLDLEQITSVKHLSVLNLNHIKFPKNIKALNIIRDERILIDGFNNLYNFQKFEQSYNPEEFEALSDILKKEAVYEYIKLDTDVKNDKYIVFINNHIMLSKFNFKEKKFIEYHCDPIQFIEIMIEEMNKYFSTIIDYNGNRYFDDKNNNLILNDIIDKIYIFKVKEIIQIMKEIIEKKVLLKTFSANNIFEKFHIYLCKINTLLDIFRDSYITWIRAVKIYNDYYCFWFKAIKYKICLLCGEMFNYNDIVTLSCKNHTVHEKCLKNKMKCEICNPTFHPLKQFLDIDIPVKYSILKNYKKIKCPIDYKLSDQNFKTLETKILNRFEYILSENNQDMITSCLGTIFGSINHTVINKNTNIKLLVGKEYRTVLLCSSYLNSIKFINSNKCNPEIKLKIQLLRSKIKKKYKDPSKYKELILVEDYITQDYYICKHSDLKEFDAEGICDKFNYPSAAL